MTSDQPHSQNSGVSASAKPGDGVGEASNKLIQDNNNQSTPDSSISTPSLPVSSGDEPQKNKEPSSERTILSVMPPLEVLVASTIDHVTDDFLEEAYSSNMLPEGTQLAHFVITKYIGGGGMGRVYLAIDTALDRKVAIKVLPTQRARDQASVARFMNEAKSAARLNHEHIAQVYFAGEQNGIPFIAFEYVQGTNVRTYIEQNGVMPLPLVINYLLQITHALAHAAIHRVIHRDVKPSNILITGDGRAKLIDMGLARLLTHSNADNDLTASGVTLGTFDYISPEQARDPRNTDIRSDLYSLGCTFFFMLTGRPPFSEGTVLQKLLQHQGDEPPDVCEFQPDIPIQVSKIIQKMMAKDPKYRYQSPPDLIDDLTMVAKMIGLRPVDSGNLVWKLPTRKRQSLLFRHSPWLVPMVILAGTVFLMQSGLIFNSDDHIVPTNMIFENKNEPPITVGSGNAQNRAIETVVIESDDPQNRNNNGNNAPPKKNNTTVGNVPSPTDSPPLPSVSPGSANPQVKDTAPVMVLKTEGIASEIKNSESPFFFAEQKNTNSQPSPGNEAVSAQNGEVSAQNKPKTEVWLPGHDGMSGAGVRVRPQSAELAVVPNLSQIRLAKSDVTTAEIQAVSLLQSRVDGISKENVASLSRLVVDPSGRVPNSYRTVIDAIRVAANDAKIEICTSDTIEMAHLDFFKTRISLLAGTGYHPTLIFRPTEAAVYSNTFSFASLIDSQLLIDNINVEMIIPQSSNIVAGNWTMFDLVGLNKIELQNCILTVRNAQYDRVYHENVAFFRSSSPVSDLTVSNENRANESPAPIEITTISLRQAVVRGGAFLLRCDHARGINFNSNNVLIATNQPVFSLQDIKPSSSDSNMITAQFQHNTIYAPVLILWQQGNVVGTLGHSIILKLTDSIVRLNKPSALAEYAGGLPRPLDISSFYKRETSRTFYQNITNEWVVRPSRMGEATEEKKLDIFSDETAYYHDHAFWQHPDLQGKPIHQLNVPDFLLDQTSNDNPALKSDTANQWDAGMIPQFLP